MILFSDLHLKPESADTCFEVLDAVLSFAKANGETTIAFLGDFWHVRYSVPVELLNKVDAELDRWLKEGIEEIILLPGNHDQVDVNGQNALKILERKKVFVHEEPVEDGHGLWLPYRRDGMVLANLAAKSKAKFCFTHHGLVGAQMNNHIKAGDADGINPTAFQNFTWAFFGHWHRHQILGNCVYVGSPWQTKADELGQTKGFIQLDEKAAQWRFIPLNVGKKYLRATSTIGTMDAKPGDVVRLPHDVPKQFVQELLKGGIEVRVDPPPFVPTSARHGLDKDTPFRAYAEKYVEANHGDLNKDTLMALFDEVVSS